MGAKTKLSFTRLWSTCIPTCRVVLKGSLLTVLVNSSVHARHHDRISQDSDTLVKGLYIGNTTLMFYNVGLFRVLILTAANPSRDNTSVRYIVFKYPEREPCAHATNTIS